MISDPPVLFVVQVCQISFVVVGDLAAPGTVGGGGREEEEDARRPKPQPDSDLTATVSGAKDLWRYQRSQLMRGRGENLREIDQSPWGRGFLAEGGILSMAREAGVGVR